MQQTLAELATTALAAYRAAMTADQIAGAAIKVFIRKRIEAGEAIAVARGMLAPDEFAAWLGGLGVAARDVAGLLAEAWTAKISREEAIIGRTIIARTAGVALLDRDFDRVPSR